MQKATDGALTVFLADPIENHHTWPTYLLATAEYFPGLRHRPKSGGRRRANRNCVSVQSPSGASAYLGLVLRQRQTSIMNWAPDASPPYLFATVGNTCRHIRKEAIEGQTELGACA